MSTRARWNRRRDITTIKNGPWWRAVQHVARGPSTTEERAYAIRLTRNLEKDPLSLDASAARAWLNEWWEEIPDFTVRPCNLIDAPDHEPYTYGKELYEQITYSQGVFLLEHPVKTVDWNAAFLAGMNGALQVYDSILKRSSPRNLHFLTTFSSGGRVGNWRAQ